MDKKKPKDISTDLADAYLMLEDSRRKSIRKYIGVMLIVGTALAAVLGVNYFVAVYGPDWVKEFVTDYLKEYKYDSNDDI